MSFADLAGQVFDRCRDTFGEAVEYTPFGGSAASVTAVFNEHTTFLEAGVQVQTKQPNLQVKIADLADEPKQKDRAVVRGVTYSVTKVDGDGEGWAFLLLQKV